MKTVLLILTISSCVLLMGVPVATGQTPPEGLLGGQIELQLEEKKQSQYDIIQDEAIEYFGNLRQKAQALGQGEQREPVRLVEDNHGQVMDFLSAVYLYCVIRNGKCPLVLDAILEADLIEAKLADNAECPNMTVFWARWRDNDFEQRQNYSLSTGRMVIASDFAREQLPRYLNCRRTVAAELADSGATSQFFKKRYGAQSEHLRRLAKMARFLELFKEQVGDVYVAVGARR